MDGLFFEDEVANVYRTKHFIVEQVLCLKDDNVHTAQMCSHDTFIRRTKKRDAQYEKLFASRKQRWKANADQYVFEKICVLKGKKLRANGAFLCKKYDLILIFVMIVSRFLPDLLPVESGEKRKKVRYNRRVKRRWEKRGD